VQQIVVGIPHVVERGATPFGGEPVHDFRRAYDEGTAAKSRAAAFFGQALIGVTAHAAGAPCTKEEVVRHAIDVVGLRVAEFTAQDQLILLAEREVEEVTAIAIEECVTNA